MNALKWVFAVVLATSLVACGGGNAKQTESGSITLSIGRALSAYNPIAGPDAAGRIAKVDLAVTGPVSFKTDNLLPFPINLQYEALPLGSYTFVATAYDGADNILFQGTETREVKKNECEGLVILMQQMVSAGTVAIVAPYISAIAISDAQPAIGQTINLSATVDFKSQAATYLWTSSCNVPRVDPNIPGFTAWEDDVIAAPTEMATDFTTYCGDTATLTFSVTDPAVDATAGKSLTSTVEFSLKYAEQGAAPVEIKTNSWPDVLSISTESNAEPVPGGTVDLVAVVQDADGDDVTVTWSSACSGVGDNANGFSDVHSLATTWTAPNSNGMLCGIILSVDDGRGGTNTGAIMLKTAPVLP
jgi:hypothetical protein